MFSSILLFEDLCPSFKISFNFNFNLNLHAYREGQTIQNLHTSIVFWTIKFGLYVSLVGGSRPPEKGAGGPNGHEGDAEKSSSLRMSSPQVLTIIGGAKFISWHLRHPFLGECRWGHSTTILRWKLSKGVRSLLQAFTRITSKNDRWDIYALSVNKWGKMIE